MADQPVPSVSPDVLNPMELRVTKLLVASCSVENIATAINSDRQMVESYRAAIYEKLRIHDPATLVRWAVRFDVGRW